MQLLHLVGLAAVAAEAPAAGGVAVLLNGGFEQSSVDEPHPGLDHADTLPSHWTLSNGASIQSGAPSPMWPGFWWARLSGEGAWLEQPSSAGGEGTFQLSLYARLCAPPPTCLRCPRPCSTCPTQSHFFMNSPRKPVPSHPSPLSPRPTDALL